MNINLCLLDLWLHPRPQIQLKGKISTVLNKRESIYKRVTKHSIFYLLPKKEKKYSKINDIIQG